MTFNRVNELPKEVTDIIPPILYKYRNWSDDNHKRLLTENELYFSPFRGFGSNSNEYVLDYDYDNTTDHEIFSYFYNQARSLENITDELVRRFYASYHMERTDFRNPDHQRNVRVKHRNRINCTTGILSMTDSYANETLWKDFACNFEGFVVGLDSNFMFNTNGVIDCIAGFVDYYSPSNKPFLRFPITDEIAFNNYLTNVFSLPEIFENEEEFRLVKSVNTTERLYPFDVDNIREIILGYRISRNSRREILDVIRNNSIYCSVVQQNFDFDTSQFSYDQIIV